MLSQFRKSVDLTPLTDPIKNKVLKEIGSLSKILQNKRVPNDVKSRQLNEEIIEISLFSDKLLNPLKDQISIPIPPHSESKSLLIKYSYTYQVLKF